MSASASRAAPRGRGPRGGGWVAAGVVAAALALVGLVSLTPPWRDLERRTFDLATALVAPGRVDAPVVIVAIDEPSFAELGLRWPFPRDVHAALIDRVAADGARAIGVDILFAEPSGPADAALAAAIRRAGNVVLAMVRERYDTMHGRGVVEVRPLPLFTEAGARVGDVGLDPDPDFVVRRLPDQPAAFARVVAAAAGLVVAPVQPERTSLLRYSGPRGTVPSVHYYQAVTSGLLPAGFFKDRIVLVGLSVGTSPEVSRAQADLYNAPFFGAAGVMPGVEIHANALASLASGRTTIAVEPPVAELLALALAVLVAFVGWRFGPLQAGGLLALAIAAVPFASLLLLTRADRWLSPLLPMVAAAAAFAAQAAQGFVAERARVRETRAAFARYVPPEVVERLADHPEALALGGEERELTILFADLANFTDLAEGLTPRQVVGVLTDYFEAMSQVIHRHGGTVDKYIGDGIMAFWGAPLPDAGHARHGLEAAIAMQEAFKALAAAHAKPGRAPLAMRIGLHSGPAIVGNVGSALRFTYTAVGDAVNLAARLEGANKRYGTSVLVSEATVARAAGQVSMRPVDAVTVQGKREVVHVFTPCADASLVEATRRALAAYRERRFPESMAIWREIVARHPDDRVAATYVERLEGFEHAPPPAGWDGVTALEK